MLHHFFSALNSYGKAIPFLSKKGFKGYLILPILINILLLSLAVWLSVVYGEKLTNYGLSFFDVSKGGWAKYLSWIVSFVIRLVILLIYFSVFRYVVLIVLSPFLSFLSEKVEHHETGREFPFSLRQLGNDILRSIRINARNFFIEISLTLLLSLLAFIPFVGLISPIAIVLVQSYFFGFALMDYNAERYRWSRKETSKWMKTNYSSVTGIGLAFHFCFLIPILGWIVAPVLATIAGTLTFLKIKDSSK